ncbi:DUF6286 domain-containing protein [Corynebacterium pelargi]|uniref:Uncharacterized protein n=1 Tax=Corynebacterium pelargi TaxID=1471400 RepID=A0A410WB18_9CORY|nr:DUF6286 domain-containing protein [Corynebacterium pelargi]QAU53168.1 hypothetical protein CPELA_09565 [Corynebacterium pelargi]GGG74391.1 hypothetical protein GCM10007338_09680 [Corynebacterium pelargi]
MAEQHREANTEALPAQHPNDTQAHAPVVAGNEQQTQAQDQGPKYLKGSPAVRVLMILFSLLLIALAVICGRELWWVRQEGNGDQAWIRPLLDWIANLGQQDWFFPVGIAIGVLGVVLLILALKPAPPKYIASDAGANTRLYLRPIDIARRATAVAERVSGVYDAQTTVNHKATKVTVNVIGNDDPSLAARVEDEVRAHVEKLASNPKVRVVLGKEEE